MPGFPRLLIAASTVLLAAFVSRATSHGPLPAHTGAFGEPSCHRCHSDYPLNESSIMLRLDSLPRVYEPEHSYLLRLQVRHPELKRAGFQLSARFTDGSQAGTFIVNDTSLLRLQRSGDVEYVSHTARSTYPEESTATWRVEWRAPAADRRVVFSVAVNVSNDDASEFGDRIYTSTFFSGGEPVRK